MLTALALALALALVAPALADAQFQVERSSRARSSLAATFSTASTHSQVDYGLGWSASGQPGGFEVALGHDRPHLQLALAGNWLHEGQPVFRVDADPRQGGEPQVQAATGNREIALRLEVLGRVPLGVEGRWSWGAGLVVDGDFWYQVDDASPAWGLSWLLIASLDPALRLEWQPATRFTLRVTPHVSALSWASRPDEGFMDAAFLLAGVDAGTVQPTSDLLATPESLQSGTVEGILADGGRWAGPADMLCFRLPLQASLLVTPWMELRAGYTGTWLRHVEPWTLRRQSHRLDMGAALRF